MKRLLLLTLFAIVSVSLNGLAQQNVYIPDPALRNYWQNVSHPCFDGDSLDVSCNEVVALAHLYLNGIGIEDPTGLEHFPNLTQIHLQDNNLTHLWDLPEGLLTLRVSNNQLESLPELPSSLYTLECHVNNLTELPSVLPPNLNRLECQNNQLTELPTLPNSLQTLYCGHNDLSALPNMPASLTKLKCQSNNISSLFPGAYYELDCRDNSIAVLPEFTGALNKLRCDSNLLTSLPPLVYGQWGQGADHVTCSYNQITELPQLPEGMYELDCSHNNLTTLPGPIDVDEMNCSYNQLTELPEIVGTDDFDCSHNQISSMGPVTANNWIHSFNCSYNQLTALSDFDLYNLYELDCSHNLLVSLPNFSDFDLYELNCSHNELITLPPLQGLNMSDLNCSFNNLYVLPPIPEDLYNLDCSHNNLNCLPQLPVWMNIEYAGNNLTCWPNDPQFFWPTPTLPLCNQNMDYYCTGDSRISGRVFYDANDDCQASVGEIGLANRVVYSSSGNYALSGTDGYYYLFADSGSHTINQELDSVLWFLDCPVIPYEVQIEINEDPVENLDFPNNAVSECHWLTVEIGSGPQRPCFSDNGYYLQFCNTGTAIANDAYIDLEVDSNVFLIESSPIDFQYLGENVYRFELGDLEIEECGLINILDSVSCDLGFAVPQQEFFGLSVCATAQIFPTSPCLQAGAGWDSSSVSVDGACMGANISFVIKNEGTGNMALPSNYRIYQDNALEQDNTSFQLDAGESMVVTIPSDGMLYRLEADQVHDHPGTSLPRAFVEACGPTPWSLGLVDIPQENDIDGHIATDCTQLTGSYDPNDKRVVPAGYGPEHFVHQNDSLLEYMIRFQNTGTDTAFNVVILDTLDATVLDPLRFVSGASSHSYTVEMFGEGIVAWHFNDILLPDSNINEPLSHGFVKFKIMQRPDLPNGTVITNSAAIYFDFNAPVITEDCFITIDDGLIITDTYEPGFQVELTAQPNPFTSSTLIRWNSPTKNSTIEIRDGVGRLVRSDIASGIQHELDRDDLPNGLYFISLLENGRILGNSRIVISD